MEQELLRFFFYMIFGLSMEVVCSVCLIERCLGFRLEKQTPHGHLEGFVSLYMIPIHGLGMLIGFEATQALIGEWHWTFRYLFWCVGITGLEALTGFIYHRLLGFYPWDYYRHSKYKIFSEGYTLWTLLPLWGVAGMLLEIYSKLIIAMTPSGVEFLQNLLK